MQKVPVYLNQASVVEAKRNPFASARAASTWLIDRRQSARVIQHAIGRLYDMQYLGNRALAKLKAEGNPFNGPRMAAEQSHLDTIRPHIKHLRAMLTNLGHDLHAVAPFVDAMTSLVERCDLLNVNEVDRSTLTEESGIIEIAFGHGLENSATYRGDPMKRSALFDACHAHFCHLLTDPTHKSFQDKLHDMTFGPNGPFFGVPTYTLMPDGSFKRRPPQLAIHDENGARLAKQKLH